MIKNVQMNVKTATGYDSLLPVTTATNVSYVNTSSELVATSVQQAIDEVAVNVIEITLPSAGWIGTTAPYSQTITVAGIIANSGLITLGFKPTTDAVMQYILSQSNIICSARAVNSLTFLAYGMKPNVAINIIASVSGGEAGIINALPGSGEIENVWQRVEVTTSQTWVVPAGVTEIDITCVGGGAGGSSGANSSPGGGGGSGYIKEKKVTVVPGTEYLITIGSAGAVASNGGNTSFGSELVANGGLAPNGTQGGNGEAGGGAGAAYADTSITRMGGQGQNGGAGGFAQDASSQPGKGTDTAKGGNNAAHAGGGGAGVNGGDGGDGISLSSYGLGGGAGGYGSERLTASTRSGKGYGAGGGAYDTGAPGICIIKYRKAVTA